MTQRRLPTVFAACAILLCTAGLPSARSQGLKPVATGNETPASASYPAAARSARAPVRDLSSDAKEMEALAETFVARRRIPGMAMALVQDGRILSARGYGVTDVRNPQPIGADTVFRVASLSKAFAGTVTGLLVSEGALRWDSRVADYMPGL